MRCPKCGFISFDNVEKCLKCKRNISATSKLFQGSVLNVATPVFLNLNPEEDEVDIPIGDDEVIEDDIEITDPDLDILLEDDEGSTADVQLELEGSGEATELETAALEELNDDLSEIEAFTEDEPGEEGPSLDLGMIEEAEEEEAFSLDEPEAPSLDVPDELADLSDLSPPKKEATPEASVEDPDIDLDFGDFGDALDEVSTAAAAEPTMDKAKPKEQKLSLDMDEDLDFELDLGGLSIHDDK